MYEDPSPAGEAVDGMGDDPSDNADRVLSAVYRLSLQLHEQGEHIAALSGQVADITRSMRVESSIPPNAVRFS